MLSLFFTTGANAVKHLTIYKLTAKFFDILAGEGVDGVGAAGMWTDSSNPNTTVVVAVTAVAGIAIAAAFLYSITLSLPALISSSDRGHLKSPWSRSKRKPALSPEQWRLLFTPEGKFHCGGVKFLKKVRSGGVDPSIRSEVWPFLLGVYELNTSEEERRKLRTGKRKEYEKLRRQCLRILKSKNSLKVNESSGMNKIGDDENRSQAINSAADTEENRGSRKSQSSKVMKPSAEYSDDHSSTFLEKDENYSQALDSAAKIEEDKSSRESTYIKEMKPSAEYSDDLSSTLLEKDENCSQAIDSTAKIEEDGSSRESPCSKEMKPSAEYSDDLSSTLMEKDEDHSHVIDSTFDAEDNRSSRESPCSKEMKSSAEYSDDLSTALLEKDVGLARVTDVETYEMDSSDSDSYSSLELSQTFTTTESTEEKGPEATSNADSSQTESQSKSTKKEDFTTWQRIIRLDAIRANGEWVAYSPAQAAVPAERARSSAEAVELKDYDHLEPCMIFHAARLVAILEAYAVYDPEIGYCQGMSDLLSPIITVMEEDHDAFWCFVGFMKKARHNFRLDEVGIRRQLNRVSTIIKCKDSHLFKHLEKLEAEDCFFVYRMVVVLFRRELTFEQTMCLWEVMWADQAAIRAGIRKSAWSRIRHSAPPTEDLLLYAIAASVLQRRKLIIEKYSSMDEIIRECNSMAGHLDVWKLLDDAHNLVTSLHDKVETPFDG
ncbi:GTPase-activating protein gyp7-like [Heracleum sosnowskyi]|uniref:GTPase-activating protein gyp7-like n=1 Tax=Heracleum sosnowskyi TaxID=360622 RepID=A0AAD8HWA1_9APIA|nr:GTPase-activating protein gyp7-like [Heracleum sosnowskyi]